MSGRHVTEALLRPAVEFYSALTAFIAAVLCLFSPWALALSAQTSLPLAGAFLLLATIRAQQGWHILRYRRNLRRLRRYALSGRQIPCSQRALFLGRGFRWEARHTQRLHECYRPEAQRFLRPGIGYLLARWLENRCESRLPCVTHWLRACIRAKLRARKSKFFSASISRWFIAYPSSHCVCCTRSYAFLISVSA